MVGIEARGFILAPALAYRLGAGFVPVRKPKKLPGKATQVSYALEYGTDSLEIHEDAIRPGETVLISDDLLATGGTGAATVELIRKLGGVVVGAAFAVELTFLNGRARLPRTGRFFADSVRVVEHSGGSGFVAPPSERNLQGRALTVGVRHARVRCGTGLRRAGRTLPHHLE